MWPYHDHSDEDYSKAIQFVEDYAVSLVQNMFAPMRNSLRLMWAIRLSKKKPR